MAYDQDLVERIKVALEGRGQLEERKMFGGYCFMLNGKMCACVRGDELMVRIAPEDHEAYLLEPGTRRMIKPHNRVINSSVFIAGSVIADDKQFQKWIDRALAHNAAVTGLTKTLK